MFSRSSSSRSMSPKAILSPKSLFKDVDLSSPDYEGYLLKRSAWVKKWRKRYFILKGDKLYFSKKAEETPHGVVDLSDSLSVKSADHKIDQRFSFEITTPDTSFLFVAENGRAKDDWIGVLGRTISRFSTAFSADGAIDEDDL